jgi:hypothetical protein
MQKNGDYNMSVFDHTMFQSLINIPFVSRIRRNHGLEHATLHILAERFPNHNLAGHSDTGGFWLLGDLPQEEVERAVGEALERMRGGESNLAVHQNCGTNFVTAGTLAGLAAGVAMFGAGRRLRDKMERLPFAVSMATLALIFGRPLGTLFQERVTTCGVPGNLEVTRITPNRRGRIKAYRVATRG